MVTGSARGRDLAQLAVREKADELAVGGPEHGKGAVGASQLFGGGAVELAHPDRSSVSLGPRAAKATRVPSGESTGRTGEIAHEVETPSAGREVGAHHAGMRPRPTSQPRASDPSSARTSRCPYRRVRATLRCGKVGRAKPRWTRLRGSDPAQLAGDVGRTLPTRVRVLHQRALHHMLQGWAALAAGAWKAVRALFPGWPTPPKPGSCLRRRACRWPSRRARRRS